MTNSSEQEKIWDNIAGEWDVMKKNPYDQVKEFLKDKTGNILDLGSGSGRHLQKIQKGKMFLVDFSEKMVKLAKENIKKQKIGAEAIKSEMIELPFENNFFDAAICIAAIHCIPEKENREKTIKELHRTLKPEAEVLVAVFNKDSKRFKNSGKEKSVGWTNKGKRYYYLYDEKEIHDLFKKKGFEIIKTLEHRVNIVFIAKKN